MSLINSKCAVIDRTLVRVLSSTCECERERETVSNQAGKSAVKGLSPRHGQLSYFVIRSSSLLSPRCGGVFSTSARQRHETETVGRTQLWEQTGFVIARFKPGLKERLHTSCPDDNQR